MSTYSQTQTFTRTEARYLAAKVGSDLHQCSTLYGQPTLARVEEYKTELVERLVKGYVASYEFGFKKDGKRVVSWQYEVKGGDLVGGSDDRPGSVYARADVAGATYYNYLSNSAAWDDLTAAQRDAFVATLPFARVAGHLPDDGNGYWTSDKTYTRGGVQVARRTYRPQ